MNDNELEKHVYYTVLFAYYKKLLTTKQQDIFCSYYYDDFSLKEIADSYNISRNAVWDTLQKVIAQLDKYEETLKLYHQDLNLKSSLEKLEQHCDTTGQMIVKDIINNIDKMED